MFLRARSHLDEPGCYVRIIFFYFSSAFNTIQPPILWDKLEGLRVDHSLASCITDSATGAIRTASYLTLRCWGGADLQICRCASGQQARLVLEQRYPLPKEANVCSKMLHVLSVTGDKCPLLCCGLLGKQHLSLPIPATLNGWTVQ